MLLPLFLLWREKKGPEFISQISLPSIFSSTLWEVKGHMLWKDSWDVLTKTLHFPYLHWEPLVCGKEDRTTWWYVWVHVNTTSKTLGSLALHLTLVAFSPWPLCESFAGFLTHPDDLGGRWLPPCSLSLYRTAEPGDILYFCLCNTALRNSSGICLLKEKGERLHSCHR